MAKEAVVVNTARQHALPLVASLVGGAFIVRAAAKHADALMAAHPGCRAGNFAHTGCWYADTLNVRVASELGWARAELPVASG